MKNYSKLLLLMLAFAAPIAHAADEPAKPAGAAKAPSFKAHVLNRAEVDALLAKPDQVLFIDVRRPDEITAKGTFPVYLNIQAKELEKNIAFIPKERTIVTVSNHAGRAGKSADLLIDKGFKVAGATGSESYESEGGTLTRIVPPPPKPATAAAAK